jgi:hypothetical protein
LSIARLPDPPLVPTEAGRLWDLSNVILNRMMMALEAAPKLMDDSRPPLPDRCLVSYGDLADEFGTDTLAVEVVDIRLGVPGIQTPNPIDAAVSLTAMIDIRLVREVPVGDEDGEPVMTGSAYPTEDETTPIARQILSDGWTLIMAVIVPVISYTFLDPATIVSVAGMQRIGPDGGAAGWVMHLEVQL